VEQTLDLIELGKKDYPYKT